MKASRFLTREEHRMPAIRTTLDLDRLEERMLLSATYQLTDLGTFGADHSYAYAINSSGQVAGAHETAGDRIAFLWDDGFSIDILDLGYETSQAVDVNDLGHVTGNMDGPFLYDGIQVEHVAAGWASAINDDDQIAGTHAPDDFVAYVWDETNGLLVLPDWGGDYNSAEDLNNAGQVVGGAVNQWDELRPVLWQDGQIIDLGTLGGPEGIAIGINEAGQVVGDVDDAALNPRPFLFEDLDEDGVSDPGEMQDLGVLSGHTQGWAWAINESGQIVGASGTAISSRVAAAWIDGEVIDLTDAVQGGSAMTLILATDINDAGQIVGYGELNGHDHAFLLTPVAAADDEPPTALLDASDVTQGGAATHAFTVTYADNVAVDVSTLDDSDIRVTGPGGFDQVAEFVNVDVDAAGTPRTATYSITAPDQGWEVAHNGLYTVYVATDEVEDTSGNPVEAGELGTFNVSIPQPPTSDLLWPPDEGLVTQATLNATGYIEVTFIDRSGTGLDASTITDPDQEFTLTGAAAQLVALDGAATWVEDTVYRYTFTGGFGAGEVDVEFTAEAWADNAGGTNEAETESFTVLPADVTGPRIIDFSPAAPQPPGLDAFEVTFSEAISAGSFMAGDVTITGPDAGDVPVTDISHVTGNKYRISFNPQQAAGTYSVQIGPDVRDLSGNRMDQDADGHNGEPEDVYSGQFGIISGLFITGHEPITEQVGTVDYAEVTFNEEIEGSTFTADDVIIVGPGAGVVDVDAVSWETGNTYRILFAEQNRAGVYVLVVGPDIETPTGGKMNQDGDPNEGEPIDDSYWGIFTIAMSGLRITSHTPSGTEPPGVAHVDVTFTEDIVLDTFDVGDVDMTGPNGAITPTEVVHVVDETYRVVFPEQRDDGTYTLRIGPDIETPAGCLMNQDGDTIPGEATDDQYRAVFVIDDKEYEWYIIDLGALDGDYSMAMGLNDECRVVGATGLIQDERPQPFIWEPSDQEMHGLDTLAANYGMAYDINNNGDVVGITADASDEYGVKWVGQTPQIIFPDGDVANAINSVGVIVGADNRWQDGVVEALEDIADPGWPTGWDPDNGGRDISDHGDIVGSASEPTQDEYGNPLPDLDREWAFIMTPDGQVTPLPPPNNLWHSFGFGVDPSGSTVAGYYFDPEATMSLTYACIWENGQFQDLHTWGPNYYSIAKDVNDEGKVVGMYGSIDPYHPDSSVFIYEDGQMNRIEDVVDPDHNFLTFQFASGVNEEGDVAGWGVVKHGVLGDGEIHAFLMTRDKPKPLTADLDDPAAGDLVAQTDLNNRGYIQVTFYDENENGLNHLSIEDADPEFYFAGPGVSSVTLDLVPTLVSSDEFGETWKYTFQGAFQQGEVDVYFINGAWADTSGILGEARWRSFTVGPDPDQWDKDGPDNTRLDASSIQTDGTPESIQTHNIHETDDIDWVTFSLATDSSVIIQAKCLDGHLDMYLYKDATLLERDQFSGQIGQKAFPRIVMTGNEELLPGDYYVKVESLFNSEIISEYDLSVEVIDLGATVTEVHNWDGDTDPSIFGRYFEGIEMTHPPAAQIDPKPFTFEAVLSGAHVARADQVKFVLPGFEYTDTNGADGWTWPDVPIHQLGATTGVENQNVLTVIARDVDENLDIRVYQGVLRIMPQPLWLDIDTSKTFWDANQKHYKIVGLVQPDFLATEYSFPPGFFLLGGQYGVYPGFDVDITAGLECEPQAVYATAGIFVDVQFMSFMVWSYADGRPLHFTAQELGGGINVDLDPDDLDSRIVVSVGNPDVASLSITVGSPHGSYFYNHFAPPPPLSPFLFFPFKDKNTTMLNFGGDMSKVDFRHPELFSIIAPWDVPKALTGLIFGFGPDLSFKVSYGWQFTLDMSWMPDKTDWRVPKSSTALTHNFLKEGAIAFGPNLGWGLASADMNGKITLIKNVSANIWRNDPDSGSAPSVTGQLQLKLWPGLSLGWYKFLDEPKLGQPIGWRYVRFVIPDRGTPGFYDSADYWDLSQYVMMALPMGAGAMSTSRAAMGGVSLEGEASGDGDTAVTADPYLASRTDGTQFMAYVEDTDPGEDMAAEVFLKRKASGEDWGAPVQVTSDGLPKSSPVIGFAADGDPIVAWSQLTVTDGTDVQEDLMSSEIYWARFDEASGTPGQAVRLTDDQTADGNPSLAVDGQGVLTWGRYNLGGELWEVRYATWDDVSGFVLAGLPLSQSGQNAWGAQVAIGPGDYGLAVWSSGTRDQDGFVSDAVPVYSVWDKRTRTFSAPQAVPLPPDHEMSWWADVAFGSDGRALVTWSEGKNGEGTRVYAATYDPSTDTWGTVHEVMTGGVIGAPQAVVGPEGQAAVMATGWHEGGNVWVSHWNMGDPPDEWTWQEDVSEADVPTYDVCGVYDEEGNIAATWIGGTEPVYQSIPPPAPEGPELIESQSLDGAQISIYDIEPSNGQSSPGIAWSWGEFVYGQTDVVVDVGFLGDGIINLIMLFGDGAGTTDLGIEVTGNAGLASLIDARTNPQSLGFLASDGYVGTVSLGAGITGAVLDSGQSPTAIFSDDYVRTVIAKGDVDGDLVVGGNLTLLQLLGGDLNGDVTLTGSNVGTVMAIATGGQGGSIAGDVTTPNGNVSTVMAIGGGISGSIQAPTGKVGTVMAINGAITSPTIYGQTGVNLVQAITGGVASSITSGASLGTVMAINGDLDLTGGRSISAGSTINALMAINGHILGDGVTSPDIYVGNGNLSSLMAIGGGMQSVWVDVNGSGASAGRLSSVYVGGSVTESRFEADGLLSSLFSLGSFTNSSVQAGSLSVVYVGGTISEDSTDGDTDLIHANAGSYFVIDSTKFSPITAGQSDTFSGVAVSVG